jgi:hypothetical protein
VTDFTEIDHRARDAAERLHASVDDSIPSLDDALRRSNRKRARGMTVMAAVLICAVVGVVALGSSMMRTTTERPEAGVRQLQGAWALPKATDAVSTEPRPSATTGATKPPRTHQPANRVVTGPWTAVVRGNRLTLRDPATNTAIVQRIESHQPGQFSVVEAASGGTASFGCANVGDYSFEQTDGGGLRVHEVADSCDPRVDVLIAGVWTGLPLITSTGGLPTDETTPSASTSGEPEPTVSLPEPGTPSPEEPAPPEQPLSTP